MTEITGWYEPVWLSYFQKMRSDFCCCFLLSCVIGIGTEAADVAGGSVLGSNVTVFLIAEVLLNLTGFVIAFNDVNLARLHASG